MLIPFLIWASAANYVATYSNDLINEKESGVFDILDKELEEVELTANEQINPFSAH